MSGGSLTRESGRSPTICRIDDDRRPITDEGRTIVKTEVIQIHTGSQSRIVDMTREIGSFCAGQGDGLVSVFVPHATAGVAIFETGAGTEVDVLDAIDGVLPRDPRRWTHEHGTPGHGRDHVVPAFISPSITVPVVGGVPQLGTWQSIVLVDTNLDNEVRTVRLSFLSSPDNR
jgi:secondary thiamine-phosphate synthase enzyme